MTTFLKPHHFDILNALLESNDPISIPSLKGKYLRDKFTDQAFDEACDELIAMGHIQKKPFLDYKEMKALELTANTRNELQSRALHIVPNQDREILSSVPTEGLVDRETGVLTTSGKQILHAMRNEAWVYKSFARQLAPFGITVTGPNVGPSDKEPRRTSRGLMT
jgi:hypothetical protein